jgi:hypothetical protein
MQTPADSFTTPAPAPQVSAKSKRPVITYDELVHVARSRVLEDFTRQQAYRAKRHKLRQTGEFTDMIPTDMDSDTALTRAATSRLLKEHTSTSWSWWFFQWSVFGGFAVTSVVSVMSAYLGVMHNRMFFPLSPFSAILAYRSWNMLEQSWEQQKYADNAAQIREKRMGNPMLHVARTDMTKPDAQEPKSDDP